MSSEMPFPCSQENCLEFHGNTHGFCQKHRFNRFWRKAAAGVIKVCKWLELIFLLAIQAAAEIQSRVLLMLILLSLLPVSCIFLEQSTGMSTTSICITFLVVALGSCLYTAMRLDGMQQRVFHAALATEASYFQVLTTPEASGHLIQVCSMLQTLRSPSSVSEEVLQNKQDLRSNYKQARLHLSHFQSAVCDPLAIAGHEVVAKIKAVTELDEGEGAVDVLYCEVLCDSLQQVQDVGEALKELDVEIVSAEDFFAMASSKKCCRVVVSVQGYLATVFLMEKSLSSLEAQKGMSDVADSLGLLDKTQAASWDCLRGDSEIPKWVLVATAFLRLVAFCSCVEIAAYIQFAYLGPGFETGYWSAWRMAMTLPFWTCSAVLLWELRCCCCCLFCSHGSFRTRLRPTQVWYRKYLGVQGSHYALKVAALQFITVLFQGLAKASLFQAIQDSHGTEALKSSIAVQSFMGLLFLNILFPAVILAMPHCVSSRVAAAVMDAVLDLGYIITSLWLYIIFLSADSLGSVFLNNFWNYMSLYISVAHVLCVCKSLETADWGGLFVQTAATWRTGKMKLISLAYVFTLLGLVGIMLGGTVLNAYFGFNSGLCPPCKCSALGPRSLLLEKCIIRTGWIAKGAPPLEFNLMKRNIVEVEQKAFHVSHNKQQEVAYLSLRGNRLTYLPEGLFSDVLEQGDSVYPSIDLGHNRLTVLSPGVFKRRSGLEAYIGQLHLDRNLLTTVAPGLFEESFIGQLYLQNNNLTQLHSESFRGLWMQSFHIDPTVLDMSRNQLEALPPRVFDNLSWLNELNLGHNKLSVLPEYVFDLHDLRSLNLEHNLLRPSVRTVPSSYNFARLNLEHNQLTLLDRDLLRRTSSLLELKLGFNQLTTLPDGLFDGVRKLRNLQLQSNQLQQLPSRIFQSLGSKIMDDSPEKIFVNALSACIMYYQIYIDRTW